MNHRLTETVLPIQCLTNNYQQTNEWMIQHGQQSNVKAIVKPSDHQPHLHHHPLSTSPAPGMSLDHPSFIPVILLVASDCILSEWGEWSDCSVSCGIGGIKYRMRDIVSEAKYGGAGCGPKIERTYCSNLPPCPDNSLQQEPSTPSP